ncbi:MAG: lipoate--protein ligase [Bacteroidales bacterium]
MFFLASKIHDPFLNLATEDYLLHESRSDFIFLYINDPSVIVGKHQVAQKEVNIRFTIENHIPVVRRISGGGTVYHDRGNLNFTFIRQSSSGKQIDFKRYIEPIVEFLNSLGINATAGIKNDIRVGDLKISGNAEHVFRERVLHHGTLLFDTSLDDMRLALRPAIDNYTTRAVESNRTNVLNLKDCLPGHDTFEFMKLLAGWFKKTVSGLEDFELTGKDLEHVESLAVNKYRTWEWNWGYAPPYNMKTSVLINGEFIQCSIGVKDGIITSCSFDGKLADKGDLLVGCRHDFIEVSSRLAAIIPGDYKEELYKLF